MPRRIPDHLVPIQDAAAENGLSVETLYRWINLGRLHRIRVPGDKRTFLDRGELERALLPHVE